MLPAVQLLYCSVCCAHVKQRTKQSECLTQNAYPWNPSSTFHTSVAAATVAPAYAAASAAAIAGGGRLAHRLSCSSRASRAAGSVTCSVVALQGQGRSRGERQCDEVAAGGGKRKRPRQLYDCLGPHLTDSHASLASPACTKPTNRCHCNTRRQGANNSLPRLSLGVLGAQCQLAFLPYLRCCGWQGILLLHPASVCRPLI